MRPGLNFGSLETRDAKSISSIKNERIGLSISGPRPHESVWWCDDSGDDDGDDDDGDDDEVDDDDDDGDDDDGDYGDDGDEDFIFIC